MVRCTDRPDMTIAVDWDVKNQTKPKLGYNLLTVLESDGIVLHLYFSFELHGLLYSYVAF